MTTVFIGLGSNLGDRSDFLRRALDALDRGDFTAVEDVSSVFETSPLDVTGEPFLNAVARIRTSLSAAALMEVLIGIETSLGRERGGKGTLPRTIDLDVLLFGDMKIQDTLLTVPHPRMTQRRFVMEPLAELAPGLIIPGEVRTAREIADDLGRRHPDQVVRNLGPVTPLSS